VPGNGKITVAMVQTHANDKNERKSVWNCLFYYTFLEFLQRLTCITFEKFTEMRRVIKAKSEANFFAAFFSKN
jgi:hypothetical protein